MPGSTASVPATAAKKLTSITARYAARSRCSSGGSPTPASLTSTSRRPSRRSVSDNTAVNRAVSVTSQTTVLEAGERRRSSVSSSASRPCRRATPTTVAPASARSSAKRRPSPEDAPVTTATAPFSSNTADLAGKDHLGHMAHWRAGLPASVRRWSWRSRDEHHLAGDAPFDEPSHHRGGVLEGALRRRRRMQPPVGHHGEQLVQHQPVVLGMTHGPGAPVDAHHRAVVEEYVVEGHGRDGPTGEPDDEVPAEGAQGPQGCLAVAAADGVDHHVDAAARELACAALEVVVFVGDGGLGTHGDGCRPLVLAGGGGDDPGTERHRHVDGCQAHATAGPEHEDPFARPEAGAPGEGEQRGAVALDDGGRLGEA